MKNLLLLLLLCCKGLFNCCGNDGNDKRDGNGIVNIPDAKFKAYLVRNSAINTNGDAEIQVSEAITYNGTINCSYYGIFNLKGIEAFTALTYLDCSFNKILALDVSSASALTTLYCGDNRLTSLDVNGASALTTLYCSNNQLTSLDVSKNSALTSLNCDGNKFDCDALHK